MSDVIRAIRGTVWVGPDAEPLRDGVVVVRDGEIVEVGRRAPDGVEVEDCSGCTIMAGFWNCHVHFFERKWADAGKIPAAELAWQLEDMVTRWGFTTVFDLSSPWENTRQIRERIESGEVAGPRILSTGEGMLPKDPGLPGDPVMNLLGVMKTPPLEVGDATEVRAAARRLIGEGVDAIKMFVSAPSKSVISESAMAAAVEEAHAAGKLVFVHPNSGADVAAAVRAGVDIIAHTTPYSGPWDAELVAAMRERGVALIPTMKVWMEFMRHDRRAAQEKVAETGTGQLRAWVAAGGMVLFGTDISYVNYDPAMEYGLMSRAGMSFRQILASLTTGPAEKFGRAKLGRVAAGFEADLTVVRGDPEADLRALGDIRLVVRGGEILYRGGR